MLALFFANRADLIDLMRAVEKIAPLTYVRCGAFAEDEPVDQFETALDIPWLGEATEESSIRCETFLVIPRGVRVTPRRQETRLGTRLFVDQAANPDSVTFTGAGMHRSGVMLHGRVASASGTPTSKRLMNRFRSALRRQCKKVKAFYLGAEAEKRWLRGTRLTLGLQSSPEFDLRAT